MKRGMSLRIHSGLDFHSLTQDKAGRGIDDYGVGRILHSYNTVYPT